MQGEVRIVDLSSAPEGAPLTEAQSGLWYVQRIDPNSPILNTGQYLEIEGALDLMAFRQALDQMAAETEALALRFVEDEFGVRQIVDPSHRPELKIVDLSGRIDAEDAAHAEMRRDTDTPLDLACDRLSAFTLFRIGPERFFWYERIHHLATDGYGIVLVTNRVAELYSALKGGKPAGAPPPPLQRAFDDDAAYRESERREIDRAYWLERFRNLPEVTSLTPGRPVSAHWFRRETARLDDGLMGGIRRLAEAADVTWPDALTALVAAYCARLAGAPEHVAGIPHMGRLGSAAARVPCMLMNVLPLRIAPDEDLPMRDFLIGVSRDLAKARRHGRYRSEQLRRDLGLLGGARRLYGPLINVQPFDLPPKMTGLDVRLHILGAGAVEDITFTFRGDAKEALVFEVDANPDLYSEEEVSAHAKRLRAFLEKSVLASSLSEVPTASPDEIEQLIHRQNATAHAVIDATLAGLIEGSFVRAPDASALVFDGATMTYRELDRRSAGLASLLAERGVGRETIVAVALPRSFELMVALVAVLRAGGAYLPLDLDHPRERLARILRSARPVCVLALDADAGLFPTDANVLGVTQWPTEGAVPASPARADDAAYVIYTSGSTGEPKGVVIEHRAIVNRLEWMRQHYGFDTTDRILQKTPATFDVSVWEFFLPLITGATLVIAPPGAHRDPDAIAALIRDEAITTLHFVPSMLSVFLASPASRGLSLKRVFCSGEELTADQRDRFHRSIRADLHNLYGPTEAAVDVSYWPASPEDRTSPVPIGFPVWNTRLYVLDERMRPLPPCVAGDLYLGGVQLARGYLGRPDLTEERFASDPFLPGERIYRTGDLARKRMDGAVVFLGRSDHQVKIRGLRIELGEIEATIMASGLVAQTGVVAREDRPGVRQIVAYLVADGTVDIGVLRAKISSDLPEYMIPAAFLQLGSLPVTANGKLDRAAFPAPHFAEEAGVATATRTEIRLGTLFAEVLGLDKGVGPQGDFFTLGGDSLLAINLTLRIRQVFGSDPGLGALFEHPTVSALAALIDRDDVAADEGLEPLVRLAAGNPLRPALFIVHPAGGIAWGYRWLARALGDTREIYGLQSPALDASKPPPESLAALAEDYVERITAQQPQGPYHLAGWSVGGIIAHEMACVLRAQGREVGMVALLDAYPADCWRAEPEPDEIAALRSLLTIAGFDPQSHPELVTREAIVAFLRDSGSLLGNLPPAVLEGVARVVPDTNRLVRGHHHRRYDGGIVHVRASLDHKDRPLTPDLWRAYAASVDVIDAPFLHPQLTRPEAVAIIAPALGRRLAALDEGES